MEMILSLTEGRKWFPNKGPQTEAYFTEADELFYGGAAGGGKTDLMCGLGLEEHVKTLILRREGTDLRGIEGRLTSIMGGQDGYNQQRKEWRLGNGRTIELGSCQHEKDKYGYQGRDHDLKQFDEITQFTKSMYNYIIGWNRSTIPGQRCRIVCAGNPPSTVEGGWVKREWGPWLDKTFPAGYRCIDAAGNELTPAQAEPGELRFYTTDEATGETVWVDPDWRGVDADGNIIEPKSRTFIPALLSDNPYLGSDYRARVAAMPEPLRSQLLYGDFNVAEKDQVNQVIPTAWLRAAQDRWDENGHLRPMISVGADIAQGGNDKTSLAPRHIGDHVGKLTTEPGISTPDGPTASALIVAMLRNGAQVNIDMGGGYGQSTHDHLKQSGIPVLGYNGANTATRMPPVPTEIIDDPNRQDLPPPAGESAILKYANMRAQAYWEFRLRLDPANNPTLALPPDEELIADLAAPVWKLTPRGILIEPKEHVKERLGRSPDKGDAVIMAFVEPKDDIAAEARHFPRAVRNAARQADNKLFDPLSDW
jgi:hypothetical protein